MLENCLGELFQVGTTIEEQEQAESLLPLQQVWSLSVSPSLWPDKDFGELTFRLGVPASCGIVLFRIAPTSPEHVARTAITVLESRDDWAGRFSVLGHRGNQRAHDPSATTVRRHE